MVSDSRIIQRQFYRSWSLPFMKVFLGAMFTYQLAYYAWLKLETMEEKQQKDSESIPTLCFSLERTDVIKIAELQGLEAKLKDLRSQRRHQSNA